MHRKYITGLLLILVTFLIIIPSQVFALTVGENVVIKNDVMALNMRKTIEFSSVKVEADRITFGNTFYKLTTGSGKVFADLLDITEQKFIQLRVTNTTLTDVTFLLQGRAQVVQLDSTDYPINTRWLYVNANQDTQIDVNNARLVYVSFEESGGGAGIVPPVLQAPPPPVKAALTFYLDPLTIRTQAGSIELIAVRYYWTGELTITITQSTILGNAEWFSRVTTLPAFNNGQFGNTGTVDYTVSVPRSAELGEYVIPIEVQATIDGRNAIATQGIHIIVEEPDLQKEAKEIFDELAESKDIVSALGKLIDNIATLIRTSPLAVPLLLGVFVPLLFFVIVGVRKQRRSPF